MYIQEVLHKGEYKLWLSQGIRILKGWGEQ